MKTLGILIVAMMVCASAEAKLMKCTMTSYYNATSPQKTSGIIDTSDENARIELNARNSQVQPYAMVTAMTSSGGYALVNIVGVESGTQFVKPLTGNNAGTENFAAATDANGVAHAVRCSAL